MLESGFLDRSTRSAMRLHLNYPEFYGQNIHPITTQREVSVRCLPQLGIESAKCVFGEINDVSTRPWAWTWAGGLSKAARGGRRAAIKPFHKPMHRIPLSIQQFQLGMANAWKTSDSICIEQFRTRKWGSRIRGMVQCPPGTLLFYAFPDLQFRATIPACNVRSAPMSHESIPEIVASSSITSRIVPIRPSAKMGSSVQSYKRSCKNRKIEKLKID